MPSFGTSMNRKVGSYPHTCHGGLSPRRWLAACKAWVVLVLIATTPGAGGSMMTVTGKIAVTDIKGIFKHVVDNSGTNAYLARGIRMPDPTRNIVFEKFNFASESITSTYDSGSGNLIDVFIGKNDDYLLTVLDNAAKADLDSMSGMLKSNGMKVRRVPLPGMSSHTEVDPWVVGGACAPPYYASNTNVTSSGAAYDAGKDYLYLAGSIQVDMNTLATRLIRLGNVASTGALTCEGSFEMIGPASGDVSGSGTGGLAGMASTILAFALNTNSQRLLYLYQEDRMSGNDGNDRWVSLDVSGATISKAASTSFTSKYCSLLAAGMMAAAPNGLLPYAVDGESIIFARGVAIFDSNHDNFYHAGTGDICLDSAAGCNSALIDDVTMLSYTCIMDNLLLGAQKINTKFSSSADIIEASYEETTTEKSYRILNAAPVPTYGGAFLVSRKQVTRLYHTSGSTALSPVAVSEETNFNADQGLPGRVNQILSVFTNGQDVYIYEGSFSTGGAAVAGYIYKSTLDCPAGYYAQSPHNGCEICGKGFYSNEANLSECKKCALGYYQDSEGQTSCKKCPESSTTDQVGTKVQLQCQCAQGQYGNVFATPAVNCAACPEVGAECNRENTYPVPSKGYFLSQADPDRPLKCIPKDSCPGGELDTCTTGYDLSYKCSRCEDGYYRSGDTCTKCAGDGLPLIGFFALVGAAIMALMCCSLVILYAMSWYSSIMGMISTPSTEYIYKPSFGGVFGSGWKYAQLSSLVFKQDVAWPTSLFIFGGFSSSVGSLNVFDAVFQLECGTVDADWAYVVMLYTKMAIPIIFAIPWLLAVPVFVGLRILCLPLYIRKVDRNFQSGWKKSLCLFRDHFKNYANTFVRMFLWGLLFVYVILISAIIDVFTCYQKDEGSAFYLTINSNVKCFTLSEGSWPYAMMVAAPFFVVYGLGIPLVVGVLLLAAKGVRANKHPQLHGVVGFLYAPYKTGGIAFFWMVFELFNKLNIGLTNVLVAVGTKESTLVMLLVTILFCCIMMVVKPFSDASDQAIERSTLVSILCTAILGNLVAVDAVSDGMLTFFTVITVASHTVVWVVFLYVFTSRLVSMYGGQVKKALLLLCRKATQRARGNAAVAPEPKPVMGLERKYEVGKPVKKKRRVKPAEGLSDYEALTKTSDALGLALKALSKGDGMSAKESHRISAVLDNLEHCVNVALSQTDTPNDFTKKAALASGDLSDQSGYGSDVQLFAEQDTELTFTESMGQNTDFGKDDDGDPMDNMEMYFVD